MKKTAVLASLAAMTLLDISAATPALAQGVSPFAGGYVGGHAGYFTGDASFSSPAYILTTPSDDFAFPARNESFDLSGLLAGVHAGINFVNPGNILFGLEGDLTNLGDSESISASGVGNGVSGDGFTFQRRSEIEFDWQGTIRARAGVISGNTLFFATVGVAFLNVDWKETGLFTDTDTPQTISVRHSDSDTVVGGVIGGGVEIAITPTMIVGVDGLYENFGSFNVSHGFANAQRGKIDDLDVFKVRARVSIKFGGGAP